MKVACYCGHTFEAAGDLVICPSCGMVASVPSVSLVEIAQMQADLAEILAAHPEIEESS